MGEKSNVFRLKAETDGKVEFFSLFEELHWIQNSDKPSTFLQQCSYFNS